MNITIEREKQIKSQRARELDELRSQGVANARKSKFAESKLLIGQTFAYHFVPTSITQHSFSILVVSKPLTTPEEAQLFLSIMRDESRRKEGFEHKAPNHVTSDGMDGWYMMQRNQEKELRLRRQEAEKLLRGYRGPYFSGEDSPAWSPRSHRTSRSSFGLAISESLVDPATEKRRQTTLPRIEHHFDDSFQPTRIHADRKTLDPAQIQLFENSGREREGGMGYDYDGRSIFRENRNKDDESFFPESREPAPSVDSPRVIDSTQSRGDMTPSSVRKSIFSIDSRDREDNSRTSFPAEMPDIQETIWREFISSGKHEQRVVRAYAD
jgi:hypothetical protein